MQERLVMRWHFLVVVSIVACLITLGSQSPGFGQDDGGEFFYYSDGERIPLILSSRYVGVRFEEGREYDISSRFPSVATKQSRELTKNNLVLCYVEQKPSADNAVRNLMSEFAQDPDMALVAPVFEAPGALMIVTDEFIAQFSSDVGENDISDLNDSYGVDIVEKATWADNTYILRVRSGNALQTANAYHQQEEVTYAHPNFVRIMRLMPPVNDSNNRVVMGTKGEVLPPDTPIEKGSDQYRVIEPSSMTLPDTAAPVPADEIGPMAPVSETTIKTEGFEGAFPNSWTRSGTPTWDKSSYRAYWGSWSGYCVGSSVSAPGPYPNNANSWMVYGPFSLADALDARVDLQAWIYTEASFDSFAIVASVNGTNFYGSAFSGNWAGASGGAGWMNIALDLKRVYTLGNLCGQSQVWIGLNFSSDSTVTYEGAYVDQVVIEKITGGYESLTSDAYDHLQWSLNNNGQLWGSVGADIQAQDAWSISYGSDTVTVAIIDEGVDLSHPDLSSKMASGYDATDRSLGGAPEGDDAHGTNCAGIAAAVTDNSQGVAGIARLAEIMPIRIAYGDGSGGWTTSDAWIADGINWAVSNGADVLSNSWGGGLPSTTITNAIDNAKTNGRGGLGTVVVFAAGNDNGVVHYPGTLDQVLTVGALSPCDERKAPTSCDGEYWWGSNYGSELDICAPGVHMYSTDIQGAAGYDAGDYFYNFNGTSGACPVVAGVAGLLLGFKPNLTAAEVEGILKTTADDLASPGWDAETGSGRVNAWAALMADPELRRATILHKAGATWWGGGTGWDVSSPPHTPGGDWARDIEFHVADSGDFVLLHKCGAMWDSDSGWDLGPPYTPGFDWAVDWEFDPFDPAEYLILHKAGALWKSWLGTSGDWDTGNPYTPGGDWAVDLELQPGVYYILHKAGARWNDVTGWNTDPPYTPGVYWAVDLEYDPFNPPEYLILHKAGAVWKSWWGTSGGWDTGSPYTPGGNWARDLELPIDWSYNILHKCGATWDLTSGWYLGPPYTPGVAWAVDSEFAPAP